MKSKYSPFFTFFRAANLVTVVFSMAGSSLSAGSLTWDGSNTANAAADGGAGTWDTNSTANWWNGAAFDVVWPALGGTDDDAIFANTAGTVGIGTGGVTANDLTFNTAGYILQNNTLTLNGTTPAITTATAINTTTTISSIVAGSAGLKKAGTGSLILSGSSANTYSGTTTVTAGALILSKSADTAAVSGNLSIYGSAANVWATANNQLSSNTVVSNGNATAWACFTLLGTNQTIAGLDNPASNLMVANSTTAVGAANPNPSPAGSGAGTLTLAGSGNYVFGGDLWNGWASSGHTSANGTLGLTLNMGVGGSQTLSGAQIIYTGATQINSGTLELLNTQSGNNSVFNSAVSVGSGAELKWSNNVSIQGHSASTITLADGAALTHNGTAGTPHYWVLNSALTVSGNTTINQNSGSDVAAHDNKNMFLDGGLKGSGTVTINATNANNSVVFRSQGNAANTFAGTLIVNGIANATSNSGSGIAVGGCTTGLQNTDIQLNATMEMSNGGIGWAAGNGGSVLMGALSGNGVAISSNGAGATLTVGNNNHNGTFSGAIANAISLAKTGSGTQVISGTGNSWTGTTTVNAGTLRLSNTTGLNGNMVLGASGTPKLQLEVTQGTDQWGLSNVISGTNSGATVEKLGAGTVSMSKAQTYTGNTTVTAGTLRLQSPLSLATAMPSIPGMKVWLDAADPDGNNVADTSDGASIATWKNKGTLGATADFTASATGTNNPTYQASVAAFNNKPTVKFVATDKMLANTVNYTSTCSVVYVGRIGATKARLVSGGTTNWILGYHGGNMGANYWNGGALGSAADTNPHIWINGATGGANAKGYRFDAAGETPLGDGTGGVGPVTGLTLGGVWSTTTERSDGDIAELFVFDHQLTTFERQQIEGYLYNKYYGTQYGVTTLNAASPVSVDSTATFGGYGGAGATTVASGGSIQGGHSGTGELTLSSLSFSGAGTVTGTASATAAPLVVTGALTTGGANPISVVTSGALGVGTHHMIKYGTLSGAIGDFQFPAAVRNMTLANNPPYIDVVVSSGGTPVWTGGSSGEWSYTAGLGNWKLSTDGTPTDFLASDAVLFDDTVGIGSTAVTVGVADISPGSITFNNSSKNYTLSLANGKNILTGDLIKSGSGTLTLSGALLYPGGTTLNGGTVSIASTASLGTGGHTFGGGTLEYTGANASLPDSTTLNAGGGNVSISNAATTLTLPGVIVGTGALNKAGGGSLILTGLNTYDGGTTVSGGTLQLGDGTTNPTINSTYAIGANTTLRLQYNSGGATAQTWSKFNGAGTLALSSMKNFDTGWSGGSDLSLTSGFTGTLQIERGRVVTNAAASTNNYGLGNAATVVVKSGGHLGLWQGGTFNQALNVAGTGYGEGGYESAVRFANSGFTTTWSGPVTLAADATLAASGTGIVSGAISGNAALSLGSSNQAGTMKLTGSNTYAGNTTISYGTLEIGTAGSLGSGSYAGNITNNGAFVYSSTANQTVSGTFSGSGTLTKSAASTLILSSGNGSNGLTTISGGTLQVGSSSANPTWGSGNYTIAANTTLRIEYATTNSNVTDLGALTWTKFTGAGVLNIAANGIFDYINNDLALPAGFTGTLKIDGSRVMTPSTGGLGGTTKVIVNPGGCFGMWNNSTTFGTGVAFEIAGSGYGESTLEAALRMGNSGGTSTIQGTVGLTGNATIAAGGTGIISGVVSGAAGAGLTLGTSYLNGGIQLTATNTYAGNTTIAYGSLTIGSAGSLGGGSYAGTINNNGAFAYASSANQTLSGIISGSGAVTNTGTGTLTLTGNNTYTGTTTVSAGTLQVNGSTASASAVTVGASGILGGTGTVNGTVNASGTLAPGVAGTGTLNTGAVTLTGTYACQLDEANCDKLASTGSLTLTGATLAISTITAPTATSYLIATYTGSTPSFTTVTGLPSGYVVDTNTAGQIKIVASPYLSWASSKGLTGANNGKAADPDGDSLTNLQEYAFGTDPLANSSGALAYAGGTLTTPGTPTTSITNSGSSVDYRAVFCRRKDYVAAGLVYTVQFSVDFAQWVNSADTPSTVATGTEVDAVSVPYPFFIPTSKGVEKPTFFRVSVSENP